MGDSADQKPGVGKLRLVSPAASSDEGGSPGPAAAAALREPGESASASEVGAGGSASPPATVEQLVLEHQGLVPAVLARLMSEGLTMDREDLLAFGQQGLVEAARRYDPTQGPFRRFAYYRVRGAMIDGMRQMGPWTRRGYERARMAKALDSAVESAEDGQPDPADLGPAEAAEKLRQHMANMVTAMTLGVFAEQAYEGEEIISKDPGESAEELVSERQLRKLLAEALRELPEPDGSIIQRHYLGGERLDLIAEELGFSKSWASRIHARALKKLGARLRVFGRPD